MYTFKMLEPYTFSIAPISLLDNECPDDIDLEFIIPFLTEQIHMDAVRLGENLDEDDALLSEQEWKIRCMLSTCTDSRIAEELDKQLQEISLRRAELSVQWELDEDE